MRIKKKFQGVVIPAVTPLTEDHQLDHHAVKKIFKNFREHGTMPFILGTTGEVASFPMNVKAEYIKLAGKLKQPGDMLFAGVSSNYLHESVELSKLCFDSGVDAVVATLPSYYILSNTQIRKYFEQLADQCGGPMFIYNIPATTHMSVPIDLIDELSYHPNIVGTKDSERNDIRLKDSLELWVDRPDFSHFLGWAARSAEGLLNKCDGLVPSTGNLYPGLYSKMYRHALNGDIEETRALQKHSDLLGNVYQSGKLLGESLWALKTLMNEVGLCDPYVMPPLQRMSTHDDAALRAEFHQLMQTEEMKLIPNQIHAS